MIDITSLIRVLDDIVLDVSSKNRFTKTAERRSGIIGVDVSLRISPLELPDIRIGCSGTLGFEHVEPLIDVIEEKDTMRVIALLPGIKKEDIRYRVMGEALELEIFKDCTYRNEIPFNARPEQVVIKSATVNNSVLEVVFARSSNDKLHGSRIHT